MIDLTPKDDISLSTSLSQHYVSLVAIKLRQKNENSRMLPEESSYSLNWNGYLKKELQF